MINSFSRDTLNQEIAFQMHLIFDFFIFFYRRQIYFFNPLPGPRGQTKL